LIAPVYRANQIACRVRAAIYNLTLEGKHL
jgi:hypothetical protein